MRCSFLILLALTSTAAAQLRWEKPGQQFARVPEDKAVEARYRFQNTGAAPLTIKSLRSSCGCTTARLEQKTFAPGERGEVVMKFSFGGRKGLHRKTVTVKTDDETQPPMVLNLMVNIHDPVTLAPALVWWRRGDAGEVKSVAFEVEAGHVVRVTSVRSGSGRFDAALLTTQPGAAYVVAIKPLDTTAKEAAEIKVETDFPADAPRTYVIHARVK